MSDTLRNVLEELVAACEKDFESRDTSDCQDDESVGGGMEGDCAVTFGMIRRGRAALQPPAARADGPAPPDEGFELQLQEDAEQLFSNLCEGDGEHSEALDVKLIIAAFRRLLWWAAQPQLTAALAEVATLKDEYEARHNAIMAEEFKARWAIDDQLRQECEITAALRTEVATLHQAYAHRCAERDVWEARIDKALRALDHYATESAYGDAVLFARAALLGKDVDD